jgi:Tfp pilus assembly protein PilV
MKLNHVQHAAPKQGAHGFTLIDALFAMVISGVMFTALYAGLAFGFKVIRFARENTRATQIMLERMETIRLYTWEQVTNYGDTNLGNYFLPSNPIPVPYYAIGTNNSLFYTTQIFVEPSGVVNLSADAVGTPAAASYADNMKKVTIKVDWCPMGLTNRTRSMSTYVTKNGMQTYVY